MGERTPHTDPSALHEPLAAELMTPKHRIAAQNIEIGRQRLLDSTQLKIIGTAYEQSPLTFDDAIEAAILVGHLVRQTLEFAPTTDGHRFLLLKVLPSVRQLIAMVILLWHRSVWIE